VKRNRLLLLAGAVGVAAVVAVVLIVVVAGGGSSSTASTTAPTGTTSTAAASRSLAGIPQHGSVLGDPKAPTTLVVYEDPQCPFCRQWNTDTLPTVLRDFVRPGKMKLDYRGVVIIGPNSLKGLRAIYAAGEQNKLWNMVDALYAQQGAENSGWITDEVIRMAAREAGASSAQILARMNTPAVTAQLTRAAKQAAADQVQGTPTFVVEHPPAVSQQLSLTSLEPAEFVAALDAALQQ
jgi:protein-disulfide isomerase